MNKYEAIVDKIYKTFAKKPPLLLKNLFFFYNLRMAPMKIGSLDLISIMKKRNGRFKRIDGIALICPLLL